MKEKIFTAGLLTLSLFSFGGGGEIPSTIEVVSSAFDNGEFIPEIYTCDGEDISPDLKWSGYPSNTESFVLIMDDPDAPIGTFTHWVVYDIPKNVNAFPENFPKVPEVDGIKQGITDFRRVGYGGPCPPPGKPHRYFIKVFALDIPSLGLPAGATRSQVESKMKGQVLSKGHLMGLYGR